LKRPVVLIAGGMSMGTLDLVPAACEAIGIRWRWHGVSMRPGKPVAYGRGPAGQHVFGLPGNPVSAFVCAWLFARMVIEGLQGLDPAPPPQVTARLAVELPRHRDPRPAYVPARYWNDVSSGLLVKPTPWKGSSDPFGLVEANGLLIRDRPAQSMAEGEFVGVMPFHGA
jgi:molybdopterin molybdotransferase